jgi:uncharacterized protein YjiS (DUF1127 family)
MVQTIDARVAVSAVARVIRLLRTVQAARCGARKAERVHWELSRLSDTELARRGLTRADVGRMTLEELTKSAS